MTSRLFALEEFTEPVAPPARPISATAAETAYEGLQGDLENTAAFEKGYKAGWDDAVRAESEDQTRIAADLARSLQDLGFTFHEARVHVMKMLEPLLNEVFSKVLPSLVPESLSKIIVQDLIPLAESASDGPVEVVMSPNNRAALEPIILANTSLPMTITEEPSLAEGQVYFRTGKIERSIDLANVIERIGAAVSAVYAINERAIKNG